MDLTFRAATPADSDLLADLVLGEREQETTRVAMRLLDLSDIEKARHMLRSLWRSAENWKRSKLAVLDGHDAGVLQIGDSSIRITPGVVLSALRTVGPIALMRIPARLRIQQRVSPEKPERSCVVSEIHVAPDFRGRGIGMAMLAHAQDRALDDGFSLMTLHTLTTNPARRLYERFGFKADAELTDPDFERLTGAAGNVLYVKKIGNDAIAHS
jgi:ribosomal protein S18 acetylase RimI-like enzyme